MVYCQDLLPQLRSLCGRVSSMQMMEGRERDKKERGEEKVGGRGPEKIYKHSLYLSLVFGK